MSKKNRQHRETITLSKGDVAAIPAVALGVVAEPAKQAKPPEMFMLGKKYVPKTERNGETWGKINKALSEGPKSLAEIGELIKPHNDFLGYMRRGGHVVPFVEAAVEAK